MAAEYRIAADIGGTFTDIACLGPDGALATCKLPSTPADYALGVVAGIRQVLGGLGLDGAQVAEVLHASTIATNAILERKGVTTALVTTAGFRDVLELRRIRVPRLYEPLYEKPVPLVPRRRRYEVPERIGPGGTVIRPLDIGAATALARSLAGAAEKIEAVAVCFLHAFANPAHETAVADILRHHLPWAFVCTSSEVLPEIREYERTSTTVINAYIGPRIRDYLRSLQARLRDTGISGRLLMMQSSGGTLDVDSVIRKPAQVVESGPAAGVIGAMRLGAAAGLHDLITFDMGGTTAKAALIEGGSVRRTDEYEVAGGMSVGSPLVKGGGYALKLPVIDVSEVGAGGGSIVWIDDAGALKVGPRSAGAQPGPVCYQAGGTEPTVTDANVVLGFLNQAALAGGTVPISAERARAVLAERIAAPLGLDVLDAAWGVHCVANATMMRAVKTVSTYRGRDPRDFTLFAFGGNGGVHAVELARELGIGRVLVPGAAGVFSAVGLLVADFEVALSQAFLHPVAALDPAAVADAFRAVERRVLAELADAAPRAQLAWRADLRYAGQAFELGIPVPRPGAGDTLSPAALHAVVDCFAGEHERSYGHRGTPGAAIEFVVLRVTGTVPPAGAVMPRFFADPRPGSPITTRRIYFGRERGMHDVPVLRRDALRLHPMNGPVVIEEYEGTTVVPPDAAVALTPTGMLLIELEPARG